MYLTGKNGGKHESVWIVISKIMHKHTPPAGPENGGDCLPAIFLRASSVNTRSLPTERLKRFAPGPIWPWRDFILAGRDISYKIMGLMYCWGLQINAFPSSPGWWAKLVNVVIKERIINFHPVGPGGGKGSLPATRSIPPGIKGCEMMGAKEREEFVVIVP